jgi:hypothetical protein
MTSFDDPYVRFSNRNRNIEDFGNYRPAGVSGATNDVPLNSKLDHGGIMRASIVITILTVISIIFYGLSSASEELQAGNRYKIVGPVYLSGIYRNLNNRQLNRQMAVGSLTAVRFSGTEVAFQCEVPKGTIMTIIGSAPKVWHLPFLANRYYVRLDPDLSRGLDVILELNRGLEGNLDGLNSEFFSRP